MELGLTPLTRRLEVIDTLLNLLFRCPHRRLTRPVAPITKAGQPHSQSYVVCLDCGKQFEYDMKEMRIGKLIDHSHDACVVPRDMPLPPATKVKYAVLAAVPVAIVIGAVLKTKKSEPAKTVRAGDEPVAPAKGGPGVREGE
jgi:DNA-directed RNA polymerase subunit RPC12/RpoP